tara:strand:- start:892 stop:1278 length:387 start_codon:yes stop_codon:yes gene_type:complete
MKQNNPNGFRKHKGPGKPRQKSCPNIVNGKKCEELSYNRTNYCPKCNYYFFKHKPVIDKKKRNLENKNVKKKIEINIDMINYEIKFKIPCIIKLNSKIKYESPYKLHKTEGFITPEYRKYNCKKKLVF